jgi:DNA invertase Pin-like site-specific DNA recombinase
MKIGYGRVSTRDQNPDAQRDALGSAGCDPVFVDKASGRGPAVPSSTRRSWSPEAVISSW